MNSAHKLGYLFVVLGLVLPVIALADIDTTFDTKFGPHVNSGENLGVSVSPAGDVNGDGYEDLLLAAPHDNKVYLYLGSASGPSTTPTLTLNGEAAFDTFGQSVAAADVNHDGYSDVIVGAPYNASSGTDTGRVYIYYGGASMDDVADITLDGEASGDIFGNSVASVGDINHDGYDDVVVGAEDYNVEHGRAYVYFGGASMDNVPDITITGESNFDLLGISVAGAGDVNGDGYNDLIIGARGYNSDQGRAYVYYGGPAMDNVADVTLTGEGQGDTFGESVSGAGDVNHDGYDDLVVGADGYTGYAGDGRAYVFYGGASMDTTADVSMAAPASGDAFGAAVAAAGDINHDGYDDVLVAGRIHNSNTGQIDLYYGGASMDATPDIVFNGVAAGDELGSAMAVADFNHDGGLDMIAGAEGADAGAVSGSGTTDGAAFLYFGTAYTPPAPPSSDSGGGGGGGGGGGDSEDSTPAPTPVPPLQVTTTSGGSSTRVSSASTTAIVADPAAPLGVTIKIPNASSLKKATLSFNKTTYTLKATSKKSANYTITLPPNLLMGFYPYTITLKYGTTTRTQKGYIAVQPPGPIKDLFANVFHRQPLASELNFWRSRFNPKDKTTLRSLSGAMQFYNKKGKTH